jgi:hypothetical protein
VVSVTPRPLFIAGERTSSAHCTGGWVGPRAGLDSEVREKTFSLCRGSNLDSLVVHPIPYTVLTELPGSNISTTIIIRTITAEIKYLYEGGSDRLCGLVVSVADYKHRGPGFDSRALIRIFLRELGLERGTLSLVIG